MFKKLFVLFSFVTLVLFNPQKSHAGFVVGTVAGDPMAGVAIGASVGVLTSAIVSTQFGSNTGSTELGIVFFIATFPLMGGIGAVLDVDPNQTRDEILKTLKLRYPFIDNEEAVMSLAKIISDKIQEEIGKDPLAEFVKVKLIQDEVEKTLESTELTVEQLELIINELK